MDHFRGIMCTSRSVGTNDNAREGRHCIHQCKTCVLPEQTGKEQIKQQSSIMKHLSNSCTLKHIQNK